MSTPLQGGRGRGGLLASAVAALLVVGGVATVGTAIAQQQSAPEPPRTTTAAASSTSASASPTVPDAQVPAPPAVPAAPVPAAPTSLPASPPVHLAIGGIGVDADVQDLGLNPDGTLEVPAPGPLYDTPGWYRDSVTPGEPGVSVLLGHVDSAKNGPSVFFKVGALVPGDTVAVTRADGTVATFVVTHAERYEKASFPTLEVYAPTPDPQLRLITCGGDIEKGHYVDNVVVYLTLVL